jgi:uncharacterized membrane protein
MYIGHRDPVSLVLMILMVIGAGVAISSYRALQNETYDRKSLGTNRYSFIVGIIILAGSIFLESIWLHWLREAMTIPR